MFEKRRVTYQSSFPFGSKENSILLAAEGQLVVNYDIGQLNYDRMLLYGTNLNSLNYQKIETKPDNLQQLDATTLTLDDLSLDFTSINIQKLVAENPSFTGFSLEEIRAAELFLLKGINKKVKVLHPPLR